MAAVGNRSHAPSLPVGILANQSAQSFAVAQIADDCSLPNRSDVRGFLSSTTCPAAAARPQRFPRSDVNDQPLSVPIDGHSQQIARQRYFLMKQCRLTGARAATTLNPCRSLLKSTKTSITSRSPAVWFSINLFSDYVNTCCTPWKLEYED